eukprot:3923290-Ditylum_brightwellii.AAC.1
MYQQQQLLLPNQFGIPIKQVVCTYCWIYGACNHKGKECKSKAAVHQDAATPENKWERTQKIALYDDGV